MQKTKTSLTPVAIKKQMSTPGVVSERGFTLIELMIVISTLSLLSITGIVAYVQYQKKAVLDQTVKAYVTAVQLAKERTQAQVRPVGTKPGGGVWNCSQNAGATLLGYELNVDWHDNSYSLSVRCQGASVLSDEIQQTAIPAGVTATPANYCGDPTYPSPHDNPVWFRYSPLNGAVDFVNKGTSPNTTWINNMKFSYNGLCKQVRVTYDGRIIQEDCRTCSGS